MSRSTDSQNGFSLLEIALALAVMAMILAPTLKLINTYTAQTQVQNQQYKVAMLANSIKENAKLIMDASMTECTNINTSTTLTNFTNSFGWGWRHSLCQDTSPFPTYNITTNVLTYSIDTANFAGAVTSIINNTTGYCPYAAQTATTVTFNCAGLGITNLQYQTQTSGPGNTATPANNTAANTINIFSGPHTANTNADFLNSQDFPTAVFIAYNELLSNINGTIPHYDMINAQSNVAFFAYKLDMTDLYLDRVKKTRDNLIALDAALRGYAIGQMVSEFENVPPNGLSSQDTFFVPWIWQVLATTQANTLTLCNNATTCTSIASGTQWATAAQVGNLSSPWLLILPNLMSSNWAYDSDAFGNPLTIIPLSNGCTGNVSGCVPSTNVPPLPQGSYLSAMVTASYAPRPPYSSLIISPLCTSNASYPDFCRWTVVYPN
ncbi:MAG TPA: prepilin-type N-terminal cleavage/methylation domain-containing protein [Dissulfurispiraceae bacterium]|nr:prepilin-type N-terminal cleavage/methylation domain-containing protein [Dissulfurispiraceae bacterium]